MLPPSLKRLVRDQRGATAIMIAVIAAVLIAAVSIGSEVVDALMTQRKMQAAADSAAISAANAQFLATGTYTGCNSNCTAEGYAIASADGFTSGTHSCPGNPTVYIGTPCDGPHAGDSNYIEALIQAPRVLRLAGVVYGGTFDLHGRAVAHIATNGQPCALALDPSGKDTVSISGGANVSFLSCGLAVNSNDPAALETKGSGSSLTVSALFSAGSPGYNAGSGTISAGDPTPTACSSSNTACVSRAPSAFNPYSSLPTTFGCAPTNTDLSSSATPAVAGCYRNLKLTGGGGGCSLTLGAGTYYFNGNITVNSGCTLTATAGVTLVLTGSSSNVSIAGGSTVNLTAPTTGTYAGVAIYSPSSATQSLVGQSGMTIVGAIVFPNALTKFAGGAGAGGPSSTCTTIISWQMQFTGQSDLAAGCTGTGVKPIVEPATLVE